MQNILTTMVGCSRRYFLQAAGAVTVGAALARTAKAADGDPEKKETAIMQIGVLSGTFGRPTLAALLDAVKANGLDCIQLSLGCAGLPDMPDRIAPEAAERIRHEAAEHGVEIASLQGTFNMSHPDAEHRRDGTAAAGRSGRGLPPHGHLEDSSMHRHARSRQHVAAAPGQRFAGGLARHGRLRRAATAIAEQEGVVLAFEPEVNNVVDSAKKSRRLMDEIHSPHLKMTMDAANLFHEGELAHMDRDPRRCLRPGGARHRAGPRQGPEPRRRRRPRGGRARAAGLRPLHFAVAPLRIPRAALLARAERGPGAGLRGFLREKIARLASGK